MLNRTKTEVWLSKITVALIALTVFLIPFGNASQVTCGLLAFAGVGALALTRGAILKTDNMRRFNVLILCYAVPIALSIIGSVDSSSPVRVLTMALLSYLGSMAVFHFCRDEQIRKRLLTFFAVTLAFWIIDTLFQAVVGYDILGFVPWEGTRYGGPFTDQYMLGAYLGSMSSLLLFYGVQRKWPLYLNLVVFALVSLVVLLSNTRTGWVMYAIVSLVFVYYVVFKSLKHRLIVLACCLIVGMISAVGLYQLSPAFAQRVEGTKPLFSGDLDLIENALSGRLIIWHTSVNAIKANPVNGVGARNLREVFKEYKPDREYGQYTGELALDWAAHPHQLVLEVGVGTGVIGLVGLFLMCLLLWKTWREGSPIQKNYALPLGTMLLAAYFPFNTHSAHYSSKYALFLWMMIALFVAYIGNEWSGSEKDLSDDPVSED